MKQTDGQKVVRSEERYIEERARRANSSQFWDCIWTSPDEKVWRDEQLEAVYKRITQLVPKGSMVIDIGGGIGSLASTLTEEKGCQVVVIDHSHAALKEAKEQGHQVAHIDLEVHVPVIPEGAVVVATEVVEHLSKAARERLFKHLAEDENRLVIFSVPNNKLGPRVEAQHTVKYTAVSFRAELRKFFTHARVEVMGTDPKTSCLLGVCGVKKSYTMSVTFPARDEEGGIEKTLMTFRGIADEIVIGIDPRTTDTTEKIAARYADKIFYLQDPEGPEGDKVPEGGVHFAWIRNQCIDQCTGDWIFMTEAHEYLRDGVDLLLNLYAAVPKACSICAVFRHSDAQRWGFPWLFKNRENIRFIRSTHNTLDYPKKALVAWLPQVGTKHARDKENAKQRSKQRQTQNRKTLMEDWLVNDNRNSLYYLGNEWRLINEEKSVERYRQLLALPAKNGSQRYQARLALGKLLIERGETEEARSVLLGATEDDWTRIEHWIWLGDIAFEKEEYTKALYFYRYAATAIGEPPFTLWWIELYYYSYIPAQRLAMTYSALNRLEPARHWAERVLELLPDDAPDAVIEECERNLEKIKEAIADGESEGQ
jgi:2-polyprenyl-3-methyl-5-hydroxy-6-metoxy-1,4-benzoquinol methylase/tetratricopeptide (TPR) repeat protein